MTALSSDEVRAVWLEHMRRPADGETFAVTKWELLAAYEKANLELDKDEALATEGLKAQLDAKAQDAMPDQQIASLRDRVLTKRAALAAALIADQPA